jgi:hypothetical protein
MAQEPQAARHSDRRTEALRAEFQVSHSARLSGLLDAVMIKAVLEGMRRGTWMTNDHEGLGRELILDDLRTLDLLHFVANSPAFLAVTSTRF